VTLILVRHAMPAHGPHVPPRAWPLAPEGRAAAAELCRAFPPDAYLVASTETKAIETLAPAGAAVSDPRFDEVRRTEAYADDFRTARRASSTARTTPAGSRGPTSYDVSPPASPSTSRRPAIGRW